MKPTVESLALRIARRDAEITSLRAVAKASNDALNGIVEGERIIPDGYGDVIEYLAYLEGRILELEARVTDLQNANTREVERRRAAEESAMRWATHFVCVLCRHYGFDEPIDSSGLICRYCDCKDHGDERLAPTQMQERQAEELRRLRDVRR